MAPIAEYTFTEPGVHEATVTVTDDEGDTASDVVVVTVTEPENAAPTVQASVDKPSGPAPHAVKFTATGSDPDGPASELEYLWDFGDGRGTSLERNPERSYLEPGSYVAKVTVTDAGGDSATAEVPVTVTDPPGNRAPAVEAAVAPQSGNAPLAVLLSADGTDPDGDELTYTWAFGDGQTGAGAQTWHTYAGPGTYTAEVTATDPDGLTAKATVQVTVGNPPGNQAPTVQAAADPTQGTAPLTVRFSSFGRDPEGGSLMYVWEFGDGGMAGGAAATHTYATPGTYTAKVTVTDAQGATGTATSRHGERAGRARRRQGRVGGDAGPVLGEGVPARGLRLKVPCAASGPGRAAATVSRATARRLGLARRTLATARVRCTAGRQATVRLKPTRSAARRLAGVRRLGITIRVRTPGARAIQRTVTVR